jgi:hypothetical protein
MTWTLSVSARKGAFSDAVKSAKTLPPDLGDADQSQVEAVKATAAKLAATFDPDDGMVGLSVSGGAGASGLVSFSLSVASATLPTEEATVTTPAPARGSRWKAGERPEAPGAVDHGALEAQAAAEAASSTQAAYQPDREPEQPASAPTSLADDQRAAARKARK